MVRINRIEKNQTGNAVLIELTCDDSVSVRHITVSDIYDLNEKSTKIPFTYRDTTYHIEIPMSDISLNVPIYKVTVESIDGKTYGYFGNLTKYYNCILDRITSLDIENCRIKYNAECDECNSLVLYTHTIYDTLKVNLMLKKHDNIKLLVEMLDELCESCYDCNTNNNYDYFNLFFISMSNNEVIPFNSI